MLTGQTLVKELECALAPPRSIAGSEIRHCLAQVLQKNEVVGEISDVRAVTLPGKT